jgi:transcription initiation factor TFIID TATA-box-binding protein
MVSKTDEAEYEPEHSDGVVYKPGEPGVAALIFSSGKIVCTGTKSPEDAKKTIEKVVDRIRETGVEVPSSFDIKIEKIVAISRVPSHVDLKGVSFSLENTEYDPSQLPGLVYRMSDPQVSFIIFESGKIICSGARSMDEIQRALRKLRDDLKKAGVGAAHGKG